MSRRAQKILNKTFSKIHELTADELRRKILKDIKVECESRPPFAWKTQTCKIDRLTTGGVWKSLGDALEFNLETGKFRVGKPQKVTKGQDQDQDKDTVEADKSKCANEDNDKDKGKDKCNKKDADTKDNKAKCKGKGKDADNDKALLSQKVSKGLVLAPEELRQLLERKWIDILEGRVKYKDVDAATIKLGNVPTKDEKAESDQDTCRLTIDTQISDQVHIVVVVYF